MLKTIIVDDEIHVLNLLKNKLKNHEDIKIIGEYTSPKLAFEMIPNLKPDLIFLDIDMPGMNGIELAIEILDQLEHINIVFVTAYDQYAVEAFKLNAIHYILKPPTKGDIEQAIARVVPQNKKSVKTKFEKVYVSLFGGIYIKDENDHSLIKWPTAKTEELFALFMVNENKSIDKWKIIENLWPESETGKGEQKLYSTVYRLKKALKEAGIKAVIKNKLGQYTITVENVWCDLYEFKKLYEAFRKIKYADEDLYHKIFNLYSGELFGSRDYTWSVLQKNVMKKNFDELYNYIHKHYLARDEKKKIIEMEAKRKLLDLE